MFTRLFCCVCGLFLLCSSLTAMAQSSELEFQPSQLRSVVYSQTAAELFWLPAVSEQQVIGYEIARDGAVLDTRDALSFFDDQLQTGTAYRYSVTSIAADGSRSLPVETVLATFNLQPLMPANLRYTIYSTTAAELFWDRSTNAVSYDILQDATLVTTTSGTSYFTDELLGGNAYEFRVVAVDADNHRSESVTVTFTTTPESPKNVVPTPANVRIIQYSSTAAELFWDRALDDADVVSTQVLRDGLLIGSTDGSSFFDSSREPGSDYQYELIAQNIDGQMSSPAFIDEVTESDTKLIRDDTWYQILSSVVALVNAGALDQLELDTRNFGRTLANAGAVGESIGEFGITLLSESPSGNDFLREFSCDAAGSGTAIKDASFVIQSVDFALNACQLIEDFRDGSFSYSSQGREGSGTSVFDGYQQQVQTGGVKVISGERVTLADRIGYRFSRAWTGVEFVETQDADTTAISGYNMNSSKRTGASTSGLTYYVVQADGSRVAALPRDYNAAISGQFSVQAAWTEYQDVTVRVNLRYDGNYISGGGALAGTDAVVDYAFSETSDTLFSALVLRAQDDPAIASWNQGDIFIEAQDGSSMKLTPATGDFTTVAITLNGAEEPIIMPIDDEIGVRCFGPFEGCNAPRAQ